MKTAFAILPALVILQGSPLHGQDTAHHREVYARINEKAATFKAVTLELEEDHAATMITGLSDDGGLRKIVANIGGEHGTATEEYYIENGEALFIHTIYTTEDIGTGKVAARQEDRYYLKKGRLIKWLSGKEQVDPASGDFNAKAEAIVADFARYKTMLEKKAAPEAGARVSHAVGTFTGIEEGDFHHWKMSTADGVEHSYFILDGGASVRKVLDDPKSFTGRKCRVTVSTSVEEIPQAGGKMEITQVKGVEWLD